MASVSPTNFGIKTTNGQYQHLINILSDRQDIAHGITRRSKDELGTFWVYVATELNRMGPPTKDPIAWRKVWSDYKSYVKKKLVQNKKEIEVTDGKPRKLHFLNSMEQKVVRISGLEKYIKLVDGKVLISFEEGRLGPQTPNVPMEILSVDVPSPSFYEKKRTSKSNFNNHKKEELDLFEKEDSIERYLRDLSESSYSSKEEDDMGMTLDTMKTDIYRQNEAFEDIIKWTKKSAYNKNRFHIALRKVYKGLNHVYIAQKCILRETIRHNREVERMMRKRLRIKEQLLEIKASQQNKYF